MGVIDGEEEGCCVVSLEGPWGGAVAKGT